MRPALIVAALLLVLSPTARAQDWSHWRGPSYDGASTATGLPTSFSKTENVQWVADLPGPGASTPIVVGDRVFLTAIDEEAETLLAVCLDRATGKELWVDVAGSGYQPAGKGSPTKMHRRSNYASPSAVAADGRVVFFFGNGDLVAYSLAGERQWARNLQKDYGNFAFQWTFSASPTIFEGQLFMPILQRNEPANDLGKDGAESFLLAINAETGKTNYRHVRPSDAVKESLESYATVIPYVGADRKEILVVGGDVITGHDPKTGTELWRWGTWNEGHREVWWRLVPSPVIGAGRVLACGPKGASVCAVKLGGEGTLDDEHLAWRSGGRRDPVTTDVPTPLFYDGDFFVLSDLRNTLTRVDAESGEQRWSVPVPKDHKWRASPTGADGRIWMMDHGGNVLVVNAKDGEVQHQAAMGADDSDQVRSSIVVAGSSLLIRADEKLYCIGEKEKKGAHWPSFRGHRAQGIAEGSALPVAWDVAEGQNVIWRTEVPGLAHSSPVVWGDKVFVTSAVRAEAASELSSLYGSPGYGAGESVEDEGEHEFTVQCLDRATGDVLWSKVALKAKPEIKRHPKSTHANPTPAVDGERVVAFFGSDGIFCFDHDGELQWSRDFGVLDTGAPRMEEYEQYQWGFASSPVLHDGKVIVQCDIQAQSFLAVLDAKTGEDIWRVERDEDPCWATPTVHEVSAEQGAQIIVNGYKHIGGYELETGKEIWKLVGGGDVPVPTPVVADGLIYITSAHGPLRPIYAIDVRAQGELSIDPKTCEAMTWSNRKGIYMQTLLPYGGELYACSDGGILAVFDAQTGESIYRERLGDGRSGFSSSGVAGDGKVYFCGEAGMVYVVKAGRKFEILAENDMAETVMSTPAISGGHLFFRTRTHVVCVGV